MRIVPVLLAAALSAGCASQTRVAVGEGGAGGVRLGIGVQSGSAVGAIVAIGVLGAMYGSSDEPRRPPELLANRAVREQDCTKPIEDPSANLRCR